MLTRPATGRASAPIEAMRARRQLADGSERSARKLESITALGEMTRGIVHDFRNVLAMLASGLNLAQSNPNDPAKLKLALAAIREGVERGLKITNQLLAFARQQEFTPSIGDINALLTALKPFLSYGAGPGIAVVLELAPQLPRCVVDPSQLNAAILNLIVNARDAMPEGGVIRVSTRIARPRTARAGRDYVRVRVCDDGAGMPPDVLARIFDPFFTTKGDNGTGLGVPQVQASMRRLGGSVAVHSKVGKGTRFDLYFPVEESQSTVASETWSELDRWADEGGAIGPGPVARVSP